MMRHTITFALTLAALAFCAWRAGFRPIEVLVLVIAPATVSCLIIGQTSNVFLGLLLVALSMRDGRWARGAVCAARVAIRGGGGGRGT